MKNHTLNSLFYREKQSGAVLLVAMIFLLLMALVATTVIQTSELEFKMAGNEQFREEAFQYANAIATAMTSDEDNILQDANNAGTIGYTWCNATNADPGCDENTMVIPTTLVLPSLPTGVTVDYKVTRISSDVLPRLCDLVEACGEEEDQKAIVYELQVDYDGSAVKLGKASVIMGVALRAGL